MMRELSLDDLEKELLRIKVRDNPAGRDFDTLLMKVREDVKKAREWPIKDMEPERKKPLSDWWSGYPGLGSYIWE